MSTKKIAIIVDHPLRDLPACVLVGKALAEKGHEVFLVPMNWQAREIFALAPDFVLLNYIRKNNEEFVRGLVECGISYGILDTEGGFYGDLDKYGRVLSDDKLLNSKLLCHCVWGNKMYEYLEKKVGFSKEQLFLTGLPRFDFLHKSFKEMNCSLLPKEWQNDIPLILLNTKVAVSNPQFGTLKQEFALYKKLGYPDSEIKRHYDLGKKSITDNCDLVKEIAKARPNVQIVIRPHPHERLQTYRDIIQNDFKNAFVEKNGSVIPWIMRSSVLIHRQCTTAIEAVLAGIPALAPMWVSTAAEAPDAEEVSHKCHSKEEFNEFLELGLKNKLAPTPEILNHMQRIIDDWLYKVDGESYRRVSDVIESVLDRTTVVNKKKCTAKLFSTYENNKSLKGQVYNFFCKISEKSSSHKLLWSIENARHQSWAKGGKFFDYNDLNHILGALEKIDQSSQKRVLATHDKEYFMDNYPGVSIGLNLESRA
jgi:surface carbohydrate biosynthesis protein